jgi:serine phosphatase RsbU (regulator of sigma subunit)
MPNPADSPELAQLRRKIESLTLNLLDSYEELDLIYRISERLMSTIDICRQLELIAGEAQQSFDADWCWFYLEGGFDGIYTVTGKIPVPEALPGLNADIVQPVVRRGISRTWEDLSTEMKQSAAGLPRAFHCQVLKTEDEFFGALCVGRVREGRFFTSGETKLANVLGTLATLALQNYSLYRKKQQEQEALIRIQEEMRLAAQIQKDLLPHSLPVLKGYDIAGRTQPARVVGGDHFDFIPMGRDKLAIALGDVSGKGLPASLLMANLQATLRSQALVSPSVRDTLIVSNKLLYASTNDEKFVTLFYGILNFRRHRLTYCNGGHNPPFHFPASGPPKPLSTGGLILGFIEEAEYEEETVPFHPGDILLLYSDGITEASDGDEKEYGTKALVELVLKHRDLPAAGIMETIFQAVRDYCGETRHDDQTIIVVKRTE